MILTKMCACVLLSSKMHIIKVLRWAKNHVLTKRTVPFTIFYHHTIACLVRNMVPSCAIPAFQVSSRAVSSFRIFLVRVFIRPFHLFTSNLRPKGPKGTLAMELRYANGSQWVFNMCEIASILFKI